MTLDEVQQATTEAAVAAEQIAGHLARLKHAFKGDFPLTSETVAAWPDSPRERLHAMLRMFGQLHDLVGRRLFPGFIALSGEDAAGLSAKNLFRRVEALGGMKNADRWLEISVTRNILIHDYPTNARKQAESANLAWRDLDDLIAATADIITALRQDDLI